MSESVYYAHSVSGRPRDEWHKLEDHLRAVASLAAEFASAFGAAEWGRLAGLWHDLGKYRPEFQDRLAGAAATVDHSAVGAVLAQSKQRDLGLLLAFAIAGHHGGLPNLAAGGQRTPLAARLGGKADLLRVLGGVIPSHLTDVELPPLPSHLSAGTARSQAAARRRTEFWIRFLFSALVDADFLDTEAFHDPARRAAALTRCDTIAALRSRLDSAIDALAAGAPPTPVNRLRAEVLASCRAAASLPPGLFSLTVPTGGGKTLASMAFALRHAERHGLRRVIAAIPYTSIIEQSARIYREVLGESNVLEHHSNVDPVRETETSRLASENWDAPIIVTTNVQLFESLFSSRTSRCRKLHNIARSVLVLDEPQALPLGLLEPILDALRELAADYGCSVVLSTATQPALMRRQSLPQGLEGIRDIAPTPGQAPRRLRRTHVQWPLPDGPPITWDELARRMHDHPEVLAVVHRREDARILAQLLPVEGRFHLSACMCANHRAAVIERIRGRLAGGLPCRVVSTQLIEAGVDLDFPVVFRAMGGLDSIAQAAGRCNREGRLAEGRVVVFRAPTAPPPGTPARGLETAEAVLRRHGGAVDLDDPDIFLEYFRALYFKLDTDGRHVQRERQGLNFGSVDQAFRLIEDGWTEPLAVPYAACTQRLEALRTAPTRRALRSLQPFLVSIYPGDLRRLEQAGAVEVVADTVRALTPPFAHLYDDTFGLVVGPGASPDPHAYIV